jgi:hypothetical protein
LECDDNEECKPIRTCSYELKFVESGQFDRLKLCEQKIASEAIDVRSLLMLASSVTGFEVEVVGQLLLPEKSTC